MGSYRPFSAGQGQQMPFNPRYTNEEVWTSQYLHQQDSGSQDAWRSYKDDATNLQQIATYADTWTNNNRSSAQHYLTQSNWYSLNPIAASFIPVNVNQSGQVAHSDHQTLRVPQGQLQPSHMQQSRLNSNTTNSRNTRYSLRSQGPPQTRTYSQDFALPSIEQHSRSFTSIPTDISSRSQFDTLRRLTPRSHSATVTPPPAPSPTRKYLAQASLPPEKLTEPQKLLVVVDLNGTLLKRGASRGTSFALRPGVTPFMEYLFANHVVMIYTSSRPENATGMVQKLFSPKQRKKLAAMWARDKLELTREQYNSKVQVYKKLEKIWGDANVQKSAPVGHKWDQTNTVLIDDSHLKALAQPYNLLRVEEFMNDRPREDAPQGSSQTKARSEALNKWIANQQRLIKGLENSLEQLKWTSDVSRLIRVLQHDENANADSVTAHSIEPEQIQLLTPKSLEPDMTDDDESDGGAATSHPDLDELVRQIDNQCVGSQEPATQDDGLSDRSVSPIDENVWKEILEGVESGSTGAGVASELK